MDLKKTILNDWDTYRIMGDRHIISDLKDTDFIAWTVNYWDSYGVAIPYNGNEVVNEKFSKAYIQSAVIGSSSESMNVLLLLSKSEDMKDSFATLCEDFINPGEDGKNRNKIVESPISWWKAWKELLGNRNVDERVYATLGELCGLLYAVRKGENPIWNGPESSTYDVETDMRFLEIKSTIDRDKKEVTINGQLQLFPPNKSLDMVFCVFEPITASGISIDSIVDEIHKAGYNIKDINAKLERNGFEKGMTIRKKEFILHEMLLYKIDDSFPRITPQSFVGGVMPRGITKITYTADISGLTPISLFKREANDL